LSGVREGDAVTVVVGGFEPLMGCGVAHVLGTDPRVEVLASDLEDVLEDAVAAKLPRVAVLGEAVEYGLLERLKSRRSAPAVLVLAEEQTVLWTALRDAGARCLARSVSATDLITEVHRAAQGSPTSISGNGRRLQPSDVSVTTLLSGRQLEVLGRIRKGLTHAQIAHEMGLAEATVKTYSAQLRRKLGVKSSREL
jgi:two-component system nitrate/nitrite response regulator NarL